jgi:hypothetical protein
MSFVALAGANAWADDAPPEPPGELLRSDPGDAQWARVVTTAQAGELI